MELDTSSYYQYLQQITKNTLSSSTKSSDSDSDDFSFELSLQSMLKASAPAYAKLAELATADSDAIAVDGADEASSVTTQNADTKAAAAAALLLLSKTTASFPTVSSDFAGQDATEYSPYRMQELLFQMLNNETEDEDLFSLPADTTTGTSSDILQTYINQLLK